MRYWIYTLFEEDTSENVVSVHTMQPRSWTCKIPYCLTTARVSSVEGVTRVYRHLDSGPQNKLPNLGTELINSRSYNLQTDGKLEQFHRSLEEEI